MEGRPETVFQLCSRSGIKHPGGGGFWDEEYWCALIYSPEMGHLFQGLQFIWPHTVYYLWVMAVARLVISITRCGIWITLNELTHPFHRGGQNGTLK